MKEIKMKCGRLCLVDDEDFEKLSKYKWFQRGGKENRNGNIGYVSASVVKDEKEWFPNGWKRYDSVYMHRILTNCPQGMEVDHINHNHLDNRKINLRIVTRSGNHLNRTVQKPSLLLD